jgi:UDP-N-acetylglucosamine 2-epimerase (non-hydrolysing)
MARFHEEGGVRLLEPVGYLDFLQLTANARAVLTDSGGIQEETTILAVPCLTLRTTTERPVTITEGTNRLVAPERAAILAAWKDELRRPRSGRPTTAPPAFWDGRAAERVVSVLVGGPGAAGTAT